MAKKTKTIRMLVTVRVPIETTAVEARREVRSLISEQRNYALDHDEVRAVSVRSAPRALSTEF